MAFPREWCIGVLLAGLVLLPAASATTIEKLSFDQLTDKADLVVSGTVSRSWTAWDAEHKYIWTHYEVSVLSEIKGSAGRTVEIEELGGIVGDSGMAVPGSVVYQTGERVLAFLSRFPNGYLRTTGWGQGKYRIDAANRLHGDSSLSKVEMVTGSGAAASDEPTLDGMTLNEAAARVTNRVRIHAQERVK
ncbi:MAG TPA: hypothetical protein VGM43_07835 [Bryobacteraceae bacterium]